MTRPLLLLLLLPRATRSQVGGARETACLGEIEFDDAGTRACVN